eukprot:gnl/TRDRNA2_/TRDRNA2_160697_c0_seq7.p1 gnl/TRDRNA2_/TRDRNA2_160697_c0~~gnl/TRDRNA2_/TRDRNA2_160697_c0_seq7.p1  ORF type:complete len:371 (+),score=70.53 gnl/TRDRNA2_/TRDRNA2_160697_c0_seq7:55-1113(+)
MALEALANVEAESASLSEGSIRVLWAASGDDTEFAPPSCPQTGAAFDVRTLEDVSGIRSSEERWEVVVLVAEKLSDLKAASDALVALRRRLPQAFVVISGAFVAESAQRRWRSFMAGANMVTADMDALNVAISQVARHHAAARAAQKASSNVYSCAYCSLMLPSDCLWEHMPLHHVHERNKSGRCPICERPVQNISVHIHEVPPEGHEAAVVLVRGRRSVQEQWRYLVVHEFAQLGFWTPAGRAEPAEDVRAAAIRETWEEAHVEIELKAVIHDENPLWLPDISRRVVFLAEAKDPPGGLPQPKSVPDFESAGAVWATADELETVPLRAPEPLWFARYLERGGTVEPVDDYF